MVLTLRFRRHIWLGMVLLQILVPAALRGTEPQASSADAIQLLAEADRLAWLDNWPAAGPLYAEAEREFAGAGDRRQEHHARIGQVRAEAERRGFLETSEQLGKELDNPVVQEDPKLRLWCLANKGYIDLSIDSLSARKDWEQALALAQQMKDAAWEARATGELGIVSFLEGNGATAVRLVGKALQSAQAGSDAGAEIRLLSMIGNGFAEMDRPDVALGYFDQALKRAAATPDAGFPFMAFEGKADILVSSGKRVEAEELVKQALDQSRKLGRRAPEAECLILLGRLSRRKDPEQAIRYLEEAVAIAQASQIDRTEAQALFELSSVELDMSQSDKAEISLMAGIEASRRVGDRYYLPRDLTALADLKAIHGQFGEADSLYEQATDVLEGILMNAANSAAKGALIAIMGDVYTHHFSLVAQQHDTARAFEIVERARGRSLVDLLRSSDLHAATLSESPHDQEIAGLQIQLLQARTRSQRHELLGELFDAEQRRFLNPGQTNAKPVSANPVELRALRNSLFPDESLLEYVLSDPHSYCLVITREGAKLVTLPRSRKEIQPLVHAYLQKVKAKQSTLAEEEGLYSILVAPLHPAQKFRWIIVPDGVLHLLPFDALRGPDHRYVLYSHSVTYTPSSTTLCLLRRANRGAQPRRPFLGVGDVAYRTTAAPNLAANRLAAAPSGHRGVEELAGADLEALPGTKQEVQGAAQIFGKRSVVLLGPAATEAAVKAQPLSDFRVIHLAAHGVSDTKFPDRAALILASDPQSAEDGLLQAREVMSLHLNADLVTLSACDTGVGRLEGEEGVANLERAFLAAGSRAVVASLWSADDVFTEAFMAHFYGHLAHGMSKGAALRQAKLDLLKSYRGQVSPFYWAPFVMSGESSLPIISGRR